MPERRVLVVGEDDRFLTLIWRWLAPYGLKVDMAETESEGLAKIAEIKPEVIFCTVELPDKKGFAFFSKAKRLAKKSRFVLSTATLPWSEMVMHEKLKVHADLCLDKRTLSQEEFLEKMDALIKLGPARFTLEDLSEEDESEMAGGGAGLSAQELDAGAEATAEGAPGEVSPARMAQLEYENRRLSRELNEARRAASSSPFSRDFVKAREAASQKEKEVIQLQEELYARNLQVLETGQKLQEIPKKLIKATEAEMLEIQNEAEDLRQKFVQEVQQITQALAQEQLAHQETRQSYESKLAELRATATSERFEQLLQTLADTQSELAERKKALASLKVTLEELKHQLEVKENELTEQSDTIASLKEILGTTFT